MSSCTSCRGPIGCIECSPDVMKLRLEVRKLRREAAPGDEELQKEVKALREKLEAIERSAHEMEMKVTLAYNEVLSWRKPEKTRHVFTLGCAISEFLKAHFD